jgi:APA family basic amino acid/polyamine antiporter
VKNLGTWSGAGIVIANMIGAGVFISAGFMAQDLGPGLILLAWVIGAFIALAGARAYAAVARIVPRSGGEYRYLAELLHPFVGYVAGWVSLLVGFSAPIAIDAIAAGAFVQTLLPKMPPLATAISLIVLLTAVHAAGFRWSKNTQNAVVAVKLTLVIGFVVVGLVLGSQRFPSWSAPHQSAEFPLAAFASSLFFIAFAFSGWNAATYVASEFRQTERDVPRAMLFGCSLVALLYLLVNWILIANLTPERAEVVFNYETTRITLGHVVMRDLLGPAGGSVMSAVAVVVFISAMSAMILAGPRVYAAMASDGFLPSILIGREGRPPAASIVLQGAVALLITVTHTLRDILQSIGAILSLFTGLVCISLWIAVLRRTASPGGVALVAAAVHAGSTLLMLYFGFRGAVHLLPWLTLAFIVAFIGYRVAARTGAPSPP